MKQPRSKRSAPATAARIQVQPTPQPMTATAPTPTQAGATVLHIGENTETTRQGIVPTVITADAWEKRASEVTPESMEAANKALNFDALVRDLDERPKRIQRREKLLAERRALEAATGIAFTPADPMGERRFQISRYVDAYAEGELAFKDLERQAALRAIADDAERNLAERFNYSPRVTLTRVLARLKADL